MPASKSQLKAIAKWQKEKTDEVRFRVPKGEKEKIHVHADSQGESITAFLRRAVSEAMERDRKRTGQS